MTPSNVVSTVSGIVLAISGVLPFVPAPLRKVGVWLLVAVGAGGLGLATDLFVLPGETPGLSTVLDIRLKLVLLAVVGVGFFIARAAEWPRSREGLRAEIAHLRQTAPVSLFRFLAVAIPLAMLVVVMNDFQLGSVVFYDSILQLVLCAFILQFFLPWEFKLPFFLAVSVVAFMGVLGVGNALWLFGAGLGLIGVCHLPIKFSYRVAAIVLIGMILAVARRGALPNSVPEVVWPILGSIFMFRLIVYLHDLRNSKTPTNLLFTLSYFFLLPNVVFPFFPIIDFSTYRRTYTTEKAYHVYQTGVVWILRGVIQLLCYRVVYYYLALPPDEITNTFELVQYTFANFLFYLRVSAEFHIITGLLHLFGFNLPPTNDNYLLSAGFVDIWRRINIYWKDFMQKLIFYPSYLWLTKRRVSRTTALVLTTIAVFAATWFLHGYQWFWLRGSFLFLGHDILFWTLLTLLMLRSTLAEARQSAVGVSARRLMSSRDVVVRGLKNTATIATLFFLWTLWTSPSIELWITMWAVAANPQGIGILVLTLLALASVLIAANWIFREQLGRGLSPARRDEPRPTWRYAFSAGMILALVLLADGRMQHRLGEEPARILADLTTARLNDADEKLLQRGYYEELMGVDRFNTGLWEIYSKRVTDWPLLQDTAAADLSDDPVRIFELNPSVSLIFHGAKLTTNQWGLRDKEYTPAAAPGTFRICILGPSFVMGSGVADDEVFEWVLEERLNQNFGGEGFERYEILNYGIAGYTALQELYQLEQDVPRFNPDMVIWVGHHLEERSLIRYLANRYWAGVEIPFDYPNEIAAMVGVEPGMSEDEIGRRLTPHGQDLVAWTYARVVEQAEAQGFTPVWIYLPVFVGSRAVEIKTSLMASAETAGFHVFDLSDIYDGHKLDEITVAEWDRHPNGLGNLLIAQALYEHLVTHEELAQVLGLDN